MSKVPTLNWNKEQGLLTKMLLSELEKPMNFQVFGGKREASENSNSAVGGSGGDTKVKVARRIGTAILPEYAKDNIKVVGDRVRGKIDSLIDEYRKHAKRFIKTGEGVDGSSTTTVYHVNAEGPDVAALPEVKNLWEEICITWPYFPRMHALFGARPNVTPIAVTTGVGPAGSQTQWFHPPDQRSTIPDELIDPALRIPPPSSVSSTPPPPAQQGLSASRSFGSDVTNTEPTTPTQSQHSSQSSDRSIARFPKPSEATRQAIERIKPTSSKKRSPLDLLVEASAFVFFFFS
ncbi:hypothetical protein H0H93_006886 [Arthromyces matolae]|nr:hypothetical protein H0H93_006886 [Arthromyces matolae]